MNVFLSRSTPLLSRLLSALCLCVASPGYAEEQDISERDFLQELPVVLSASRLSQPLSETPSAVTVIDRGMIKASGSRNIADLFMLVPGMYVGYSNAHTPIVAYHGSTDQYSRRMQVLVDGRSVYLPPFSSVDWEDIPLHIDDIERIEVIRGPSAASHGANSVQGVINIITRDASSVHGTEISVSKGDGGISDVAAHLGKTGTDLDFRLTLGYRADNGFPTRVINDSYATRLGDLRALYHPNATDSFEIQLGHNESTRAMGITGRVTDPMRDMQTTSDFQQLTWLRIRPKGDEIKVSYYHIYHNVVDPGGQALPADNIIADRHDLELQHTLQLGTANRMVWGLGARSDAVQSPLNLNVGHTLFQSRLFVHDELRLTPSTVINAGNMLENDGMNHSRSSPRFSINYHLTPQHTLRTGISTAYRSPATLEEFGNLTGFYLSKGGLKPEKMLSREIGYLGEFPSLGLIVDARVYQDQLSDIIFIDPALTADGKPYSFRNLMGATYKGYEATFKYHWGERSNLTFNFARQIADCAISGTLTNPLVLPLLQGIAASCTKMLPWNSGSVLLSQQLAQDIQFSAGYYQQGQLQMLDTVPQSSKHRWDFRLAKSFGNTGKISGGEVALVVQNVFQDNYSGYSAVPQTNNVILFNRRAYLTARANF